jgi:predicted NUDIX family phosphoesterase
MEFVYVVPRSELFREFYPQGLVPFGPERSRGDFETCLAVHGFYVERARAEREPAWKQVIPYAVVVRGSEVLLMKRLRKGGEGRLFDKLSIGVGGHLNPVDQPNAPLVDRDLVDRDLVDRDLVDRDLVDHDAAARATNPTSPRAEDALARTLRLPLERGTLRELSEELEITGPCTITSVGILNDDANSVGAVHLGLVQVVRLSGDARIRERDVLEGTFTTPAELRALLKEGANFETWSKMLVERLDELLAAARPAEISLTAAGALPANASLCQATAL